MRYPLCAAASNIRFSCAHIAGIRGFATAFSCQSRAANDVGSSVKPTAPNTKSPISETWFRRSRRRMMRRFMVCSVCVTVPQLHAPVSDAFRAQLARTKSKPSIPLSGREVIAKSAPTILAKPDGVGVASQPWILRREQSELLTRIAATESVTLCVRKKS